MSLIVIVNRGHHESIRGVAVRQLKHVGKKKNIRKILDHVLFIVFIRCAFRIANRRNSVLIFAFAFFSFFFFTHLHSLVYTFHTTCSAQTGVAYSLQERVTRRYATRILWKSIRSKSKYRMVQRPVLLVRFTFSSITPVFRHTTYRGAGLYR